jgi:glycosyltransferase involved in cell wall biosynthesis
MSFPPIHVLLATYNGERYLSQQWASIEAQQGVSVVLHLADDGSGDGTVALLRDLAQRRSGAIREVLWMHAPPRRSATRSFLMLLATALRTCPDAQWFAYCDQDDSWLPGKLAAAMQILAPYEGSARAALYGGRTLAVDEHDREGGLSPLFTKAPSFSNAIAQNIMGGNTMVFNRAAAELVAESVNADLVTHDWTTYQLVSAAHGFIYYDPRPFVRYRQHGNNVIGSNLGWKARWNRFVRMLHGEYREWNDLNVAALSARQEVMTPANRAVLDAFRQARSAPTPWARLAWLRRSGVFRQKPSEHFMLWVACLLRRI